MLDPLLPSVLASPAPTVTATLTPAPTPTSTPGVPESGEATGSGGLIFLLLLFGLLWGIFYLIDASRYPLRTCRRCNGTGWQRSAMFNDAMRICPRCNGTRRQLRPGARHPTGSTRNLPR
ncbi:hypothetical protein GCM10009678_04850 [Actinomadura kijaniata]|uniref:Uncharacterized protein n=1 Tax=Actinomadura namibiensis TaxID=182080 RepID=A0A7W3QNV2_ACTNM|nr:hypothetical protein [Actinomadura namibiensis]MBA8953951.1 hypothetical protein [Actinomadura namibiensis]